MKFIYLYCTAFFCFPLIASDSLESGTPSGLKFRVSVGNSARPLEVNLLLRNKTSGNILFESQMHDQGLSAKLFDANGQELPDLETIKRAGREPEYIRGPRIRELIPGMAVGNTVNLRDIFGQQMNRADRVEFTWSPKWGVEPDKLLGDPILISVPIVDGNLAFPMPKAAPRRELAAIETPEGLVFNVSVEKISEPSDVLLTLANRTNRNVIFQDVGYRGFVARFLDADGKEPENLVLKKLGIVLSPGDGPKMELPPGAKLSHRFDLSQEAGNQPDKAVKVEFGWFTTWGLGEDGTGGKPISTILEIVNGQLPEGKLIEPPPAESAAPVPGKSIPAAQPKDQIAQSWSSTWLWWVAGVILAVFAVRFVRKNKV